MWHLIFITITIVGVSLLILGEIFSTRQKLSDILHNVGIVLALVGAVVSIIYYVIFGLYSI